VPDAGSTRYSICLLYWYKRRTNLLAFTGTKVQTLTRKVLLAPPESEGARALNTRFTCFPGTKVQILTHGFFYFARRCREGGGESSRGHSGARGGAGEVEREAR
jgi:hypothetical protein